MSKDGTTLAIGAPGVDNTDQADAGAVYIYKWNRDGSTNTYTLDQTINEPGDISDAKFGSSLSMNQSGTRLAVGAEKSANPREMKFDSGETTFDLQDTTIVDLNTGSGAAYTATVYDTKFVLDDRIVSSQRFRERRLRQGRVHDRQQPVHRSAEGRGQHRFDQ
jgi:hypothetical protein